MPERPSDAGPPEYRIDELARLAGTTVRNVRAYQDRGLLPGPRRVGRVGLYSEAHLARLRVIAELLGRGYTLANIGELLAGWEQGRDLSELFGLEAALIAPWTEERASTLPRRELVGILGEDGAAELIAEAERARLLEVEGDQVRVANPRMLEGAAVLMDAGVPVAAVLQLGAYLVEAIDEIAGHYVELIDRHVLGPLPDPLPAAEIRRLTTLVQQLRPLAKQVVDAELALALEHRIQVEIGERMGRLLPRRGQAAAS
jgi:DNA-binding transcriptional MerR regulator